MKVLIQRIEELEARLAAMEEAFGGVFDADNQMLKAKTVACETLFVVTELDEEDEALRAFVGIEKGSGATLLQLNDSAGNVCCEMRVEDDGSEIGVFRESAKRIRLRADDEYSRVTVHSGDGGRFSASLYQEVESGQTGLTLWRPDGTYAFGAWSSAQETIAEIAQESGKSVAVRLMRRPGVSAIQGAWREAIGFSVVLEDDGGQVSLEGWRQEDAGGPPNFTLYARPEQSGMHLANQRHRSGEPGIALFDNEDSRVVAINNYAGKPGAIGFVTPDGNRAWETV